MRVTWCSGLEYAVTFFRSCRKRWFKIFPSRTCGVRNFCTERDEYPQYISRRMHMRRKSRVSKDISQRRTAKPQPGWELCEWAVSAFGTLEHRRRFDSRKGREKESARGNLETRPRFCIKLTLEERGWHPPGMLRKGRKKERTFGLPGRDRKPV